MAVKKNTKARRSIADSLFEDTPIGPNQSNESKVGLNIDGDNENDSKTVKKHSKEVRVKENNIDSKGKKSNKLLSVIEQKVVPGNKVLSHVNIETHRKIKLLATVCNSNMFEIIENILQDYLKKNSKEINELMSANFKI